MGLVALKLLQRTIGTEAIVKRLALEPPNPSSSNRHPRNPLRILVTATLGGLAGWTTMVANAAGPVMTIYLLAVGFAKDQFMGTSAWIFCVINLSKVPFSYSLGLINWHSLGFNLVLLPAVALGALGGRWLLGLVSQIWFERLLLLSAVLAALRLIWR